MEQDKSCKKLLDEILNELTNIKTKGINISVELSQQNENLNDITSNLEDVSYQSEVSKWQLNYIDSTFGKLYKKINNYPIRESASNFIKLFSLKSKIIGMGLVSNKQNISEKEEENSKLDEISNIIKDINHISNVNKDEILKQNYMLDYNTELVESSQNKISKNTRKIKKLLN